MIIDYVFGGDSYLKASDVFSNIGHHCINFAFKFDGVVHYFKRETERSETVWICDANYKPIIEKTRKEFCQFLFEQYKVELHQSTFREVTSLFSRVYSKGNLNEKEPLSLFPKEKKSNQILRLEKIFDAYERIAKQAKIKDQANARLKAYKAAMKHQLILSVSKRELDRNERELKDLYSRRVLFEKEVTTNSLDFNTEKIEVLTSLRDELFRLKRRRTKICSELNYLTQSLTEKPSDLEVDMGFLKSYFPEIEIESLERIERFHSRITKILNEESRAQRDSLDAQYTYLNSRIEELFEQIGKLGLETSVSNLALKNILKIQRRIDYLESIRSTAEKNTQLSSECKESKELFEKISEEVLADIQRSLNSKMESINDFVYAEEKESRKPPVIRLTSKNYDFGTPDDSGTGTSYRNMIILDLAVLLLTKVPILIHDSVMLKQIEDIAVERLLELYHETGKQVFVALDKSDSYSDKAYKILHDSKILSLASNGGELFGRTWNASSKSN